MPVYDQRYWDERYLQGATGWDIGYASPELTRYFDQLEKKEAQLLLPGAGFGHEALYLEQHGFKHINVLDISAAPLEKLKSRVQNKEAVHCIQEDFFSHLGQYDLIIEQTFFCAISPGERPAYVQKVKELLKPGGKVIGLLWAVAMNNIQPPFGGSKEEYVELFSPWFDIEHMELAQHSIKPRSGRELFFSMTLRADNKS